MYNFCKYMQELSVSFIGAFLWTICIPYATNILGSLANL